LNHGASGKGATTSGCTEDFLVPHNSIIDQGVAAPPQPAMEYAESSKLSR
jgi:hypothetical protein